MRTVQRIGVPRTEAAPDVRCRGGRAEVAHRAGAPGGRESLAALAWLRDAGCRQFFFKYCSTFDSTDGRQYRSGGGCIARGAGLRLRAGLSGVSGERAQRLPGPSVRRRRAAERKRHGEPSADADDDANLVRVLSRQTDGTVGLVPYAVVEQGAVAIRAR
jgi:uncharacterized protein YgbK (DUF1537 family)